MTRSSVGLAAKRRLTSLQDHPCSAGFADAGADSLGGLLFGGLPPPLRDQLGREVDSGGDMRKALT
jgi:hypothetical protein